MTKKVCAACGGDGRQFGPPEGTTVTRCEDCRGTGRPGPPQVGDLVAVNGRISRVVEVTPIWSRYEPKSGKTTIVTGHVVSTCFLPNPDERIH